MFETFTNVELTSTTVMNDVTNGKISHVNLPNTTCNNLDKITSCGADKWRLITPNTGTLKCTEAKIVQNATL